jgi:hypothetical protein
VGYSSSRSDILYEDLWKRFLMEWAGRNWEIQLERVHLLNVIDDAGRTTRRSRVDRDGNIIRGSSVRYSSDMVAWI